MTLIYYSAYIDFFASSILLIMLLALLYKKAYISLNGRSLTVLALIIFLLTLFEGTTFLVDGNANIYYIFTNRVLNLLLFFGTPLLLGFWVSYIYFLAYEKKPSRNHLIFFFAPTFLILILIIVNIFEPFIYLIDSYGVYERLSGFIYVSAISYILVVYSLLFQVYFLIKQHSFKITILLISNVVAFFGSFIQLTKSNSPSFYVFITLGFVIIYVFFESIGNRHDTLTKLFDRKKIYEVIESKISSGKPFSLVMLDLDNLKLLNDSFGHHIGDVAILHFSNCLKSEFPNNGSIGRIGGDEFLIISSMMDSEIRNSLDKINSKFMVDGVQYEYGFSYGISHTTDYDKINVDILSKDADKDMYEMKAIHKNYKRRKSDSNKYSD